MNRSGACLRRKLNRKTLTTKLSRTQDGMSLSSELSLAKNTSLRMKSTILPNPSSSKVSQSSLFSSCVPVIRQACSLRTLQRCQECRRARPPARPRCHCQEPRDQLRRPDQPKQPVLTVRQRSLHSRVLQDRRTSFWRRRAQVDQLISEEL